MSREYFWSKTLDKKTKSINFEEIFEDSDSSLRHSLIIQQIVLGPNAEDMINVLQVKSKSFNDEFVETPISVLKPTDGFAQNNVEISLQIDCEPVLTLKQGNGPIHINGQMVVEYIDQTFAANMDAYEEAEEECEDDEEDKENMIKELDDLKKDQEDCQIKKRKIDATNGTDGPKKVAKMETDGNSKEGKDGHKSEKKKPLSTN